MGRMSDLTLKIEDRAWHAITAAEWAYLESINDPAVWHRPAVVPPDVAWSYEPTCDCRRCMAARATAPALAPDPELDLGAIPCTEREYREYVEATCTRHTTERSASVGPECPTVSAVGG